MSVAAMRNHHRKEMLLEVGCDLVRHQGLGNQRSPACVMQRGKCEYETNIAWLSQIAKRGKD